MSKPRKPRRRFYQIPLGLPESEFESYARQLDLADRRKWYAEHPEIVMQHRIRSAQHLLEKHGQLTIKNPPLPPWTAEQETEILLSVGRAMGYQCRASATNNAEGGAGNGNA